MLRWSWDFATVARVRSQEATFWVQGVFGGGWGVVAKVRTLGAYVARASHGNPWG